MSFTYHRLLGATLLIFDIYPKPCASPRCNCWHLDLICLVELRPRSCSTKGIITHLSTSPLCLNVQVRMHLSISNCQELHLEATSLGYYAPCTLTRGRWGGTYGCSCIGVLYSGCYDALRSFCDLSVLRICVPITTQDIQFLSAFLGY
jgi:hypothetical protein